MWKLSALLVFSTIVTIISSNALAADKCNAGSCQSPVGVELSCPTSGGPECDKKECCQCKCVVNDNGTVNPTNTCVECPKIAKIINDLLLSGQY